MLADLLARVEAATGPDREIDGVIEVQVRAWQAAATGLAREHWAKWRSNRAGTVGDGFTTYDSRPYTASVDAALALVERVLPGWGVGVYLDKGDIAAHHPYAAASAKIQGAAEGQFSYAQASSPALAILAALLKAKIAEAGA